MSSCLLVLFTLGNEEGEERREGFSIFYMILVSFLFLLHFFPTKKLPIYSAPSLFLRDAVFMRKTAKETGLFL